MRKPPAPGFESTELAAIRHIGMIGANHAATALSRLTGARVESSIPEVKVVPFAEVLPLFETVEDPAVGVLLPYGGDIEGHFLQLFPEDGVRTLQEFLLADPAGASPAMRDSAITETASIMTGAFLTILSRLTGHILMSSPPLLVKDMAGAILDELLAEIGTGGDSLITIGTVMREEMGPVLARTLLLPDPAGVRLLLEAAGRLRAGR